MTRSLMRVFVVVASSRCALSQAPPTATPRDVLAATLADMRGLGETIDSSRREDWSDAGTLLFSAAGRPVAVRPVESSTLVPARQHTSAGTVSVKRLRHRVPKAARNAYGKAGRLSRNAHVEQAAQELEKAIALDPDFAEAHRDLGVAYARLNRYPEAVAEFRSAMALDGK